MFQLSLKDTDSDIVHAMQETTGHGKVRYNKNGNHTSKVTWRIRGWESCLEFAEDIEVAAENVGMFRETEKYETFVEWKEIIEEHNERRKVGEKSTDEVKELIRKAKSLNEDGRDGISEEEWIKRVEQ